MTIQELKVLGFDIDQRLKQNEQQKLQLIDEYNKVVIQINELEKKEKENPEQKPDIEVVKKVK